MVELQNDIGMWYLGLLITLQYNDVSLYFSSNYRVFIPEVNIINLVLNVRNLNMVKPKQ